MSVRFVLLPSAVSAVTAVRSQCGPIGCHGLPGTRSASRIARSYDIVSPSTTSEARWMKRNRLSPTRARAMTTPNSMGTSALIRCHTVLVAREKPRRSMARPSRFELCAGFRVTLCGDHFQVRNGVFGARQIGVRFGPRWRLNEHVMKHVRLHHVHDDLVRIPPQLLEPKML